jgi:antitoxin (DNA-binding transcriptional repressor) of toxin-antitoxin stability system
MNPDLGVEHSHMYTMRELNQHTADVIKDINESGEPAFITRHGRFVALITPLANVPVESALLSAVLDQISRTPQPDAAVTAGELARDIGGYLKPPPVRELHQPGARGPDHLVTRTVTNKFAEPVTIDVGGLSDDAQNYITQVASKLSTHEISELVRNLKQ